MAQQELADRIVELSGENVTRELVSRWERNITPIPAEIIHYICVALGCSSYQLYPFSSLPERDLRIIARIRSLPEDEKADLDYLLNDWQGDTRALLKLDVVHAVLPEWRRSDSDTAIIEAYKEAIRTDDPGVDRRVKTDLPYILKVWRKLDK